jgi:hypothetical protein
VRVWHPHGARVTSQTVFFGGAIDRRNGVSTIVTDKMQDVRAVQRTTLAVRRIMLTAGNESYEKCQ